MALTGNSHVQGNPGRCLFTFGLQASDFQPPAQPDQEGPISSDRPRNGFDNRPSPYASKKNRGWLDVSGARMCLLDISGGWVNIMLSIMLFAGEDTARRVLFEAGRSETFSSTAIKNGLLEPTLRGFYEALNIFSESGFGDFIIRELAFDKGYVAITCRDTFEAWAFLQNRRHSETPVCHYSAGVLLSFMENVSGIEDLISVETKCIADGSGECEFIIGTEAELNKKGILRPEWGMSIKEKAEYLENLLNEKNRIQRALTKKNIELSILNKISGAINHALPLPEILNLAVREISGIASDRAVGIYLVGRNGEEFVFGEREGFSGRFFKGVGRLTRHAREAEAGAPRVHRADAGSASAMRCLLKKERIQCVLCVPLMNNEQILGVLMIAAVTLDAFDAAEIDLMRLVGSQLAVAVVSARLNEEIKESESKYKTLVEDINDGYFLCQDNKVLYTNDAFLRMHGYDRAQVSHQAFTDFFTTEYMPHVERTIRDGRGGKKIPEQIEFYRKHRDGRKLPTELKINLVEYQGRPALIGIFRDISKRKEMERQVVESRRLAAIGRLSAGIAHEIRNPLSAIKTNIQVLSKNLTLEGFDKRRLEIASGEIQRLDGILEEILDYASPVKQTRVPHDIRDVIDNCMELLKDKINDAQIRVARTMQRPVPKLSMNYEKMRQAILNILLNAIEAMPDGGQLSVLTGLSMRLGRKAVRVEIKDTGTGISPEHLPGIFEPFFSQKTKGTGLGLSNVKKIVEAHDGTLQVISRPDHGTRMRILLPLE